MSNILQITFVTAAVVVASCKARTLGPHVFNEKEYMNDEKLADHLNMSTVYDALYQLSKYNYTTEDRLYMFERAVRSKRMGVDFVFNEILRNFVPYIENKTKHDHVHLLKLLKIYKSYAALPGTTGRFRAWHGRFTSLSHIRQYTNATYNAIGNQLVLVGHARIYKPTFVYRNYEVEVGDKRVEGAVTGGFDHIELRLVNSWITAPLCRLQYAFHSLYDTVGCHVNVKRLGEYESLNVELGFAVCYHLKQNLKVMLDDIFALYWRKATDDRNFCDDNAFKNIFGIDSYIPV